MTIEQMKKPKHASLKKGAPFTAIGETSSQDKNANKDVGVEVVYEKMGLIYFKLGAMFCRAPRSSFSGTIQ